MTITVGVSGHDESNPQSPGHSQPHLPSLLYIMAGKCVSSFQSNKKKNKLLKIDMKYFYLHKTQNVSYIFQQKTVPTSFTVGNLADLRIKPILFINKSQPHDSPWHWLDLHTAINGQLKCNTLFKFNCFLFTI